MLRPPIRNRASPIPVRSRRADDRRDVLDDDEACGAGDHQHPSAHHQGPTAAEVAEPAGRRLGEEGGDARCPDGDPDADASRSQRPLGEPRQDGQDDADREEREERGRGHEQESGCHHPLP